MINCCIGCKPPKRYQYIDENNVIHNCHSECEEYLKWKAEVESRKESINQEKYKYWIMEKIENDRIDAYTKKKRRKKG